MSLSRNILYNEGEKPQQRPPPGARGRKTELCSPQPPKSTEDLRLFTSMKTDCLPQQMKERGQTELFQPKGKSPNEMEDRAAYQANFTDKAL